ncbi:hypothetical protein J5X84_08855 [Streptosporangiaceae bacterium NEAU-GS5]|nr:hypothetical protein [Streptosporangiaceae bacterium NEAU-GS5]
MTVGLEHLLLGLLTANDDWRLRKAMNALGLSDRRVRKLLHGRNAPAPGDVVSESTEVGELMGLPETMLGREIPVTSQVFSVTRQAREASPGNPRDPLEVRPYLRAVVAEPEGPVAEVLGLLEVDRAALLELLQP